MKKLFGLFCLALAFNACNEKKESAQGADSTSTKQMALSLPVSYSSSFEMGNADYVAMIVKGSWKDWQDNKMDNMKSWMADTVVAVQSNNKTIRGVDSVAANWNRGRAKYTSVVDSINAATSLFSTDKKENWVLVWATEHSTDNKGKKDTVSVMETWRINKDGKADLLLQFDRHSRKE